MQTIQLTIIYTGQKINTIHHLTTMLSDAQATIKVSGHQHRCLAGGYDLEIWNF